MLTFFNMILGLHSSNLSDAISTLNKTYKDIKYFAILLLLVLVEYTFIGIELFEDIDTTGNTV